MNLITGATGLVGAHLAIYLLEKGEKVRTLYRTAKGVEKTRSLFSLYGKESLFSQLEWYEADITDVPALEKAFTGISEVYHCAALISFNPADESALRKTNIEGTANVVNLSLAFGIRKLCYVSSIAALGDLKDGEKIVTEETEWNPEKHHSDYAISKYGAEMELWRAQQEGLDIAVLIPGVILGPVPKHADWDNGSAAIFSTLEKGFPFYTLGATGFVAVSDIIALLYLLMKSPISNTRFIAVEGRHTYSEIAFGIADALGAKRPGLKAGQWLTSLALIADALRSIAGRGKRKLFRDTVTALHQDLDFSNEKVRLATGYIFTDVLQYINEIARLRK